jgi:hypothetical protein
MFSTAVYRAAILFYRESGARFNKDLQPGEIGQAMQGLNRHG